MRGLKSNLRYASNWLYGEMVSTLEIEYSDPSLNLNRSQYLENLSQHLQGKFSKKKKILKNDFQVVRCLEWLVSFQIITLSAANDNVGNNNHLYPLGLEPGTLCVLGALVSTLEFEYSSLSFNLR